MKNLIFAILVTSTNVLPAQNSPSDFIHNQCEHFTDGKGKSEGVKMKMAVPCAWDSAIDSRPNLVKLYVYESTGGAISCGLIISKSSTNLTQIDRMNIFKKEWAKDVFKNFGELSSVRKVDIDHHQWGEYYFSGKINAPQGIIHQHLLCYYGLYGNTAVLIVYKTTAFDENIAKSLYEKYEFLFKALASSVSIYSYSIVNLESEETGSIKSENASLYVDRGNSFLELKNWRQAKENYDKAIQLDPNNSDAYFGRGLAKGKLDDKVGEMKDYNKAIELNPEYSKAYHNRAILKSYLGDYSGSIQDFDFAIQLYPDEETYLARGNVKEKSGKSQQAIEDYNKAIELNPNFASAYLNRGISKNNLGNTLEAIKDYNRAIILDPKDEGAYYNRGNTYAKLENFKEAINDFSKAIELKPDYAEAYLNRGTAKVKLKNYQGGLLDFNKSVILKPLGKSYLNRGIVKIILGDKTGGCADIQVAIKFDEPIAIQYSKLYCN